MKTLSLVLLLTALASSNSFASFNGEYPPNSTKAVNDILKSCPVEAMDLIDQGYYFRGGFYSERRNENGLPMQQKEFLFRKLNRDSTVDTKVISSHEKFEASKIITSCEINDYVENEKLDVRMENGGAVQVCEIFPDAC